jgi:hypothetical protein
MANFIYLCELAEEPEWWWGVLISPVGVVMLIPLFFKVARRVGKPAWAGALVLFLPLPVMALVAGVRWPKAVVTTVVTFASFFLIPLSWPGVEFHGALRHTQDRDPEVRQEAAADLQVAAQSDHFWYRSDLAVSALAQALEDPEPRVRSQAAHALDYGFINFSGPGFDAAGRERLRAAIPALILLLDAQTPPYASQTALNSAKILGSVLGPEDKAAAPALAEALERQDTREKAWVTTKGSGFISSDAAARALTRIGPGAVPVLLGLLNKESPRLRELAARSLGEMGPQAREAVPALTELAQREPNSAVQSAAEEALKRINP